VLSDRWLGAQDYLDAASSLLESHHHNYNHYIFTSLYTHTLSSQHSKPKPQPKQTTFYTMPAPAASVYVTDDYSEPMSAQHNFANHFDLDHPEMAMTAYQRYAPLCISFVLANLTTMSGSCMSTPSAS
jgi:hypothetical protein